MTQFLDSEVNKATQSTFEWISTLPIRDGDLDLEAMGLTLEDFLELLSKEKNRIPNWDELITQFLIEVKALPDQMKESQ